MRVALYRPDKPAAGKWGAATYAVAQLRGRAAQGIGIIGSMRKEERLVAPDAPYGSYALWR